MNVIRGQLLLAIGLSAFCVPVMRAQTVWSLGGNFSATNNPTGAWSYGSATSLGGAFTVYPTPTSGSGINSWTTTSSFPSINYNPAATSVQVGTVLWPASSIIQHPGPGGEFAVARWTAPFNGTFALAAAFSSGDVFGATTNVFVLRNGTTLGGGNVNLTNGFTFSLTSSLVSGDFIDFVVGFGTNGSYFNDSTVTVGTISALAVPEPSTWVLFGFGGAVIAMLRSRRTGRVDR